MKKLVEMLEQLDNALLESDRALKQALSSFKVFRSRKGA